MEKNQENISQENSKIDTKNKIIENLSDFLEYIKTNLSKKDLSFNKIAEEIEKQFTDLHKHYKENDNKSYTQKWLKNIANLGHANIDKHEKEYLKNLRKELSKKPKLFEGFGAAVSNKQVQKNLKELIKQIDKKIKTYS